MKTEKYSNVFNSYDNLEDILNVITDDGLDELNFHKDTTKITKLGVIVTLKNRDGKDFKVIVCPDNIAMPQNGKVSLDMKTLFGKNLTDIESVL